MLDWNRSRASLPLFCVWLGCCACDGHASAVVIKDKLWEPFQPDGYLEFTDDLDRFGEEQTGSGFAPPVAALLSSTVGQVEDHTYGNIADLDWVGDDRMGGPDLHQGVDYLVWRQGNPKAPNHDKHFHGDVKPMENDRWVEPTFRAVDIFYLGVIIGQQASFTDAPALFEDFLVFGSNDKQTWNAASEVVRWTQGWIPDGTTGGDRVSRWDLGENYRYVGIRALDNDNAQIDAVKAVSVRSVLPEPSSLALCVTAFLGLLWHGRRAAASRARCGDARTKVVEGRIEGSAA